MRLVRKHERERLDDVRRGVQQHLALSQRLRNQAELVVLEVAKSAVDQLGAPRRRVRGEVVLLDEQHLKAASRSVARDAGAIDAAADDQEVVGKLAHLQTRRILPDATITTRSLHGTP